MSMSLYVWDDNNVSHFKVRLKLWLYAIATPQTSLSVLLEPLNGMQLLF